jgi:hypothetical protein
MAAQKPSVGRMVHYVAYGTPGGEFPAGICRAATITEVYEGGNMPPNGTVIQINEQGHATIVGLCVLNPTGLFFNRGIPYDGGSETSVGRVYKPGTWHWPERID